MNERGDVKREVLPIAGREHVGVTTYDAKDPDTAYPPIEPLRPPPGAPNILIVLLDDAGFGSSSAFTGKIHWVQIDLGTDDHDHLISPDERLRIAMARQ